MTTESKVKGQGREIMLPPRGDPFKKDPALDEIRIPDPDRLDDIVVEEDPDEPRDLSPDELAAMFPSTYEERNKLPAAAPVPTKAPAADALDAESPDLSPEELAAMYPSSSEERNMLPGGDDAGAVTDPQVLAILDEMKASAAMETGPIAIRAEPPFEPTDPFAEMPEPTASAGASVEASPVTGSDVAAPATVPAAEAPTEQPAATQPEVEVEPPGVGAGRPTEHYDALATGQIMEVDETNEMLRLLVTDAQITELWQKIEQLENYIIQDQAISSDDMEVNIKRLKVARNNLLGGRRYYEDAERLVAEVEYDSAFSQRVRKWSYTWGSVIFGYLLLWLALAAAAALQLGQGNVADLVPPVPGLDPTVFLTSLIAGVLGGVTGALRSLWVHVAQEQDFDPQHRMWYFINPVMGFALAVLVYWIFFAGILNAVADEPSGTGVFVLYVLAWLSGFQQNVALALVKRALNFILGASKG